MNARSLHPSSPMPAWSGVAGNARKLGETVKRLLGREKEVTPAMQHQRAEVIRAAMMAAFTAPSALAWRPARQQPQGSGSDTNLRLKARIAFSPTLEALWYLRTDLMMALAEIHGQVQAKEQIAHINQLFEGALPKSMKSRPSELA